MIYLRRIVRRRFGSKVIVNFVDARRYPVINDSWKHERPLPLIIIEGEVFSRGIMPFGDIVSRLEELEHTI